MPCTSRAAAAALGLRAGEAGGLDVRLRAVSERFMHIYIFMHIYDDL